jgi:hypothetical protein
MKNGIFEYVSMCGGGNMKQEISFLYGLATAIGSMPHYDVDAALELIKETLNFGPHWPQLPKVGKEETFVRQYLSPLFRLGMIDTGKGETPFFCNECNDWLQKMERFYSFYLDCEVEGALINDSFSSFAFPQEAATGFYKFLEEKWGKLSRKPLFLKGQLSGPLTVGLQVSAENNVPAFYRDDLRDIITKTLALNARYQARLLKKFSLPVVIFIDEPQLLSFGQSAYVALSREQISKSIGEVVSAINAEGAYAGVHCCSGIDWSILFELPLQIVSFDAYYYFESMLVYGNAIDDFLKNGGCLAWGLVPTSEAIEKESALSLKDRFFKGIGRLSRRGVKPELLTSQYLLTPSCGAGTLSIAACEKVYRITSELQRMLPEFLNNN